MASGYVCARAKRGYSEGKHFVEFEVLGLSHGTFGVGVCGEDFDPRTFSYKGSKRESTCYWKCGGQWESTLPSSSSSQQNLSQQINKLNKKQNNVIQHNATTQQLNNTNTAQPDKAQQCNTTQYNSTQCNNTTTQQYKYSATRQSTTTQHNTA